MGAFRVAAGGAGALVLRAAVPAEVTGSRQAAGVNVGHGACVCAFRFQEGLYLFFSLTARYVTH